MTLIADVFPKLLTPKNCGQIILEKVNSQRTLQQAT